jgi:hypothetical protein
MPEMQNKSFLTNLIKGVSKRATRLLHNPYKDLNISPFYLKYLKHLPPGEIKKHQMPDGEVQFINPQEFCMPLMNYSLKKSINFNYRTTHL